MPCYNLTSRLKKSDQVAIATGKLAMNFGKRDLGLVLSETVGDADTLRFTKDARCPDLLQP